MSGLDSVERYLFLEGIRRKYGYDFHEYSEVSLDRRIENLLQKSQQDSILDLLKKILQDSIFFKEMISEMTITTTEFFRDPTFFETLRAKIFPILRTYPSPRIWVSACSTGEEVYSLAIALQEEGMLDRCQIFATDINSKALNQARKGIYSQTRIESFNRNYRLSGGTRSPSDHYTAEYDLIRLNPELRKNVIFSEHNLITDSVFVEANLILCRNVLIYFTKPLQDKVLHLLSKSLVYRGIMALAPQETIQFTTAAAMFSELPGTRHIYQLNQQPSYSDFV